jgi:signal transduction histidine kinase
MLLFTPTPIEGAIVVRVPAVGEAAARLPWLSVCADSLLALARAPAAQAWETVRHDPAAVLLIVRQVAHQLASPSSSSFPAVLRDPVILDGALRLLTPPLVAEATDAGPNSTDDGPGTPDDLIDWTQSPIQPIYDGSLQYARAAQRLAQISGHADPENAWIAGLLTPLGWLAVCAVDAERAAACLTDPELGLNPFSVQQRQWGLDQDSIARRLLRRWDLPRWLAVAVGHLGLPIDIAQPLGADPDLFRIVQLAVGLVQETGRGLHLTVGADPAENAEALGVSAREQEALTCELEAPADPPAWSRLSIPPKSTPYLLDLLAVAAENRRLHDAPTVEQLERERDEVHRALERQRTGEAERLQTLKLKSLAQFAAGAAHEINNPLAVISGQAQYLLGHEVDPGRQRALQSIITQAQRVHQVLSELMQFARPPTPQRQVIDVRDLVREVMLSLNDWAAQRQIQLIGPDLSRPISLNADPRQIRTALECLLRNAIEAAPAGGWAGLRLETLGPDRLEVMVEDSGTGPGPAQRDHLFDPFYCGREAGRGRGLGLPTAWRLAREHGGDVRFDTLSGGPTRFVLSLPREASANGHGSVLRQHDAGLERANGCHLPLPSDS